MTALDAGIALALVAGALRGHGRGFVLEIAGPLSLLVGLVVAARRAGDWEGWARASLLLPDPLPAAAAFIGIALAIFLGSLITATVLDWGLRRGVRGVLNRFLGTLAGAAKAAVVVVFALLALEWTTPPMFAGVGPTQGVLAPPLLQVGRQALGWSAPGVATAPEP